MQAAPPENWHELDHEDRRNLIARIAIDLLEKDGRAAVTMRRIAERLGVGAMTLYTYVDGQSDLHRAMIREGFRRLDAACAAASTLQTADSWHGGARAYLTFALDHPALYRLLFDAPIEPEPDGENLVAGGLAPLLAKVRARLHDREPTLTESELDRRARRATARFWIALHGLASLAIADRLEATGAGLETLLEDLLERVAPG